MADAGTITTRGLLQHHLDHTFEQEAMQPSLAAAVRGLTAAQSAWKPSPRRHSIWQIVRHVTHWKEAAIAALSGQPVDYDAWNRLDWTEIVGDEAAWARDMARLHEVSGRLRSLLDNLDEEGLSRQIRWYEQSPRARPIALRALELATHDIYHAGQIQYLVALQEIPAEELAAAASRNDLPRIEEVLAAHPAAVSAVSRDGWTALHVACYFGMAEAVRLLLGHGAPPRAVSRNPDGQTPLHLAAGGIANRVEIIRMLLEAGVDPSVKDAAGRTPLEVARAHGRSDAVSVLEPG